MTHPGPCLVLGHVGTQTTLPFGTVDEVKQVVRSRLSEVRAKGGIVIGPDARGEPEVPWENLVAMAEAAAEFTGVGRGVRGACAWRPNEDETAGRLSLLLPDLPPCRIVRQVGRHASPTDKPFVPRRRRRQRPAPGQRRRTPGTSIRTSFPGVMEQNIPDELLKA